MIIVYENTSFLTSSVCSKCLHVTNKGIEIAITGYSNSGKSSFINCITNKKMLSRSSKFPGTTKMINFFKVNSKLRLVDLPGYGYPLKKSLHYCDTNNLIFDYLKNRKCLKCVILLLDIRRLLRVEDKKVLILCHKKKINIIVLITKCDKLNKVYCKKQFNIIYKQLNLFFLDIKVFLFSSFKNIGIKNILNEINKLYINIS